ncbi:hypothetical protein Tco_0165891, partial [Tanacetum coccineum]
NVENSFLGSNEQYAEIVRLKETLFEQVHEKNSFMKIVSDLKNDLKMEENKNIDREIALEKKIRQLDNINFKRGPTFELMKGTCKSLTELEYFCEEVYKATTEKLDWINPEGRQYPHDLRKPLPLVPNSQGRHVIPFQHFINNDLEYLRGGESSRKYSTSVTKTDSCD